MAPDPEANNSAACPTCGITTTTTREYNLNGRVYVMRFWACVHPDWVDGHGVSKSAGPTTFRTPG